MNERGIEELVGALNRIEFLESLVSNENNTALEVIDHLWARIPDELRACYLLKTRGFGRLLDWRILPEAEKRMLWLAAEELRAMAAMGRPGAREACTMLLKSGALQVLERGQ